MYVTIKVWNIKKNLWKNLTFLFAPDTKFLLIYNTFLLWHEMGLLL